MGGERHRQNEQDNDTSRLVDQRNTNEKATGSGRHRRDGQNDKASRPRQPGLNIVTNFSRVSSQTGLSSFPNKRHQQMLQQRRRRASSKATAPTDYLRVSKLSPSDGTLLIGLSTDGLEERCLSVKAPEVEHQPVTPEIVITPAKEEGPWSSGNQYLKPGRRPTSSVYSRATQFGIAFSPSDAPPVPNLPGIASANPRRTLQRRASVSSWTTAFSMDEDMIDHARRFSSESQCNILSPDLLSPNHRRSTGWWNTVLSPFLDRKMTLLTGKRSSFGVEKDRSSPESPKGAKDAATSPATKDVGTSPMPAGLDESRRASSVSSVWTDGRWEAERRTLAFFQDDSPREELNRQVGLHRGEMVASPEFIAHPGSGEAAEYYAACRHDQNNPTPYFACQNHDCSKTHHEAFDPGDAGGKGAGAGDRGIGVAAVGASVGEGASGKSPELHAEAEDREVAKSPTAGSSSDAPASRSPPAPKAASPQPRQHSSPSSETSKAAGVVPVPDPAAPSPVPAPAAPVTHAPAPPPPPAAPAAPVARALAPASPEAMTPSLRRDVQNHAAIPMESARAPSPPTNAGAGARRDVLQIDEPRAAPAPPAQVHRELSPDRGLALAPARAPSPSRSGSPAGREERREGPQPPVVFHQWFWQERKEGKEDAPSKPPAFAPPPRAKTHAKTITERSHKDESNEKATKPSKLSKLKALFAKPKTKQQKRRRCLFGVICGGLLALVILILLLVLLLPLKRDDIPAQSAWLNVTGFPPVPTGIATIARPDAVDANSQCVQPATMWSCAVPKEQQAALAPNAPDQPNFRLAIRYQNGSAVANSTKARRDVFTDALFAPNPPPPSDEDQSFLGKTTDNNTTPFNGEPTPFFISFLPTTPTAPAPKLKFFKRSPQDSFEGTPTSSDASAASSTSTASSASATASSAELFPNVTDRIPPPASKDDGTAAAATLLPLPSAQPLRLYNRGRADEHYGFYAHFDRSIFLAADDLLDDDSPAAGGPVPGDADGGAVATAARARCTWAQTRFLVQIWTRAGEAVALLPGNGTAQTPSARQGSSGNATSADDFARPGSFPYPVSVTLDRHGGDPTKKMVYCYGVDERQRLVAQRKRVHLEDRAAGGALVNPSQGLFGKTNVSTSEGGPGGVDGGTGGCRCQWQNWAAK